MPSSAPGVPVAPADDRRWNALADQAEEALAKGDFTAAERLARRLVDEGLRVFGARHGNTATSQSILGSALFRQGRFTEAEDRFRQALAIFEERFGAESLQAASALNNLALVLEKIGDYGAAEALLRRSLAILRILHGPDHADTATTLSNLGRVLESQGRLGASADRGTPGAVDEAQALSTQAEVLITRGEYREAESLQHRVVAIHETTAGAEHPLTATSVSNLGNVLYLQGKFVQAEQAHRRALAIREKQLGASHPDTATSLNNLANALFQQGKDEQLAPSEQRARARADIRAFSETEDLYRRALAIQENALGPDHPALAATLNNLGALLDQRGRHEEAEVLQRRSLAILEKSVGLLHPDAASTLTTLAVSLDRQGRIVEAEETYRRAVELSRRAENPRTLLLNASRLGYALAKRGRLREALPFYIEAVATLDHLYVRTRGLSEETRQAFMGQYGNIYLETIKLLLQLHRAHPQQGFDRQILEIASRNQSRLFTEMMREADVQKFSGEPAFITLKARWHSLHGLMDSLRPAIATMPLGQLRGQRRSELTAQLEGATRELAGVERQLQQRYPRFMELANPRPVTADDLQKTLLKADETLLSFVLLPHETVVFAVTRDRLKMAVTPARRDDLATRIHRVRASIEKAASGDSVLFLREVDPATLNGLYRDLLRPVEDVLAGRRKVIVVADGPLLTLPLEMLIRRYGAAEEKSFRAARQASNGSRERPFLHEYAALDYLGKHHRFAYLPSLSTLTSQRLYPKQSVEIVNELVAFADPEFSPVAGKTLPPGTAAILEALAISLPGGRAGQPVLPPLKETADEAREIAAILGGRHELFLGERAQEASAKKGALKGARYVLFATHGFLGGEFLPGAEASTERGASGYRVLPKPRAQPTLALTLVGDLHGEDGLLTMKEVIEDVELDAELVALSACNTVGETAQANNGEGFAGLTRAFMYAGAKALLVSHWSVDSLSTHALMTSAFRRLKTGGNALQGLNEAQRSLIGETYANGPYHFSRGHPFFWAPFVYVGD